MTLRKCKANLMASPSQSLPELVDKAKSSFP